MSSPFSHTDIQDLLGAYVVNAVDADERAAIEIHLAACASCQLEVDELRGVTALLGSATHVDQPPELWDRIQGQLDLQSAPPLLRVPKKPKQAARFARPLAAAAAVVVLISGAFIAGTTFNGDDAEQGTEGIVLAQRAANEPDARVVTLNSSTNGAVSAKVVVLPDGRGYVFDSSLPALPDDRTYQLWAVVNNAPVSASVMGQSFDAVAFHANGPITAFAITDEIAGGVVTSIRNPVVAGSVTA
jgi:anti-sigma-K factor RskA